MKESKAQNASSDVTSWSKERMFMWFYEFFQNVLSWFSFEKQPLPDDEAGELMRRALAQKSWFDNLTSTWVEQPWWVKCAIIVGVTLAAGITGIWFNIPVVLACLVGVLSISIHSLFVAHENQRNLSAHIMATEAIALGKSLKASKQLLDDAVAVVDHTADELTLHSDAMKANAHRVEEGVVQLKKQQEQLAVQVVVVSDATSGLVASEHQVQKQLEATAETLKSVTEVIVETTGHTEGLGKATVEFESTVRGVQASQQSYTAMVEQLGHLVQEQQSKRVREDAQQKPNNYACLWSDLSTELDDNDALIAEMRQSMNAIQAH